MHPIHYNQPMHHFPILEKSRNRTLVEGENCGENDEFLLVREGGTVWSIRSSTTATGGWIQSGRATNSPSSPEAGPRVREGVTEWRYNDNGWKEGDISVTCL